MIFRVRLEHDKLAETQVQLGRNSLIVLENYFEAFQSRSHRRAAGNLIQKTADIEMRFLSHYGIKTKF